MHRNCPPRQHLQSLTCAVGSSPHATAQDTHDATVTREPAKDYRCRYNVLAEIEFEMPRQVVGHELCTLDEAGVAFITVLELCGIIVQAALPAETKVLLPEIRSSPESTTFRYREGFQAGL